MKLGLKVVVVLVSLMVAVVLLNMSLIDFHEHTSDGSGGSGSGSSSDVSSHRDVRNARTVSSAGGGSPVIRRASEAASPKAAVADSNTAAPSVTPAGAAGTSSGPSKRKTVAFAITVTRDGHFVDGALVLGYAARKYHDAAKGYPSAFDVNLVAFVAPTVVTARPILEANGWRVLEKQLPVALEEIQNQEYAEKMRNSGCCGADEFLKLWAYTLTEYHRVVHLDMDSIVFGNMDSIFNLDAEMLFTGDYNMKGRSPAVPAQGGFLVVTPSLQTFGEFQAIIRKGDHTGKGWEGSRIGNFWGGQTIQGIVPFFYSVKHPGRAQEMNRCEYNCMVDNPYSPKSMKCLDGQETCQDCRLQRPELVKSAHFTICQKPWTCTLHQNPKNKYLCEIFHNKWFALRDELEIESGVDVQYRSSSKRFKESRGMCSGYGDKNYLPIPLRARSHVIGQ